MPRLTASFTNRNVRGCRGLLPRGLVQGGGPQPGAAPRRCPLHHRAQPSVGGRQGAGDVPLVHAAAGRRCPSGRAWRCGRGRGCRVAGGLGAAVDGRAGRLGTADCGWGGWCCGLGAGARGEVAAAGRPRSAAAGDLAAGDGERAEPVPGVGRWRLGGRGGCGGGGGGGGGGGVRRAPAARAGAVLAGGCAGRAAAAGPLGGDGVGGDQADGRLLQRRLRCRDLSRVCADAGQLALGLQLGRHEQGWLRLPRRAGAPEGDRGGGGAAGARGGRQAGEAARGHHDGASVQLPQQLRWGARGARAVRRCQ